MEKVPDLKRIKFLNGASKIEPVDKGYSGAAKFSFNRAGERYFLKIGHFRLNFDLEEILAKSGVPHPEIMEMGRYDEKANYIIEKFVAGENLKDLLDGYDLGEMYEFGRQIGETYGNLRKVYPDQPVPESLCQEYMESSNDRITKLRELLAAEDKVNTKARQEMLTVAEFLKNTLPCVKNSLMVYGHTDVKPSNFLIHNGEILALDIESTRYKEITASIMWAYTRVDFKDEKNLAFAKGYLNGLFDNKVPAGVWACCNHNYAFNMVGYFVKYLSNGSYERLNKLLRHIEKNYLKDGTIEIDKNIRAQK